MHPTQAFAHLCEYYVLKYDCQILLKSRLITALRHVKEPVPMLMAFGYSLESVSPIIILSLGSVSP
jgi:hypothetical protein